MSDFEQNWQQFQANPDWQDRESYSDPQWQAWHQQEQQLRAGGGGAQNCPPNLPFTGRNGQCAAKPDDCPDGMVVQGNDAAGTARCVPAGQVQGQGAGGGGGSMGAPSFGAGAAMGSIGASPGPVPQFDWTRFQAPTQEQAFNDPGYQFALKQGQDSIEHSAAAKGVLNTGGTLKDLVNYGQQAAAQQYGNVFNRALQGWNANFGGEQAAYAPQYGAWNTLQGQQYGAWNTMQNSDLQRWQTNQNAALQKYLQQQNSILSLINSPMPQPPAF